jgi:hypothetical protein
MIWTAILCDKCGIGFQLPGSTPKWLMERLARKKGWTCGKQHLCPKCKRGKRQVTADDI